MQRLLTSKVWIGRLFDPVNYGVVSGRFGDAWMERLPSEARVP